MESGKKLSELVDEVHSITEKFAYERMDLELNKNIRNKIMENCKQQIYSQFGDFAITKTEDIDGYKYFLGKNSWVMIRSSGTEPIIRIYVEAEDREKVTAIINAVVNTINIS